MRLFFLASILLMELMRSASGSVVSTSGRKLYVDGASYTIKGVCYNPVSKGETSRSFENIEEELALMREAGINTIRVYSPISDRTVLDKIHAAGIKIIVGIGYNQQGRFDILSGSFIDYVNTYKTHDAILFWELGNEYNYHPEWFGGAMQNWYDAMNKAAEQIHSIDPDHPVGTAHGELPKQVALSSCPNIDIWGMNVYRWDNPEAIFQEWEAVSDLPMYLSEAGADSYMAAPRDGYDQGSNEKAQADATRAILDDIFRFPEVCAGVTLFAFSDEWWKAGNPEIQDTGGWAPGSSGVPYDGAANEEYWGIVDINRQKKAAFDVVKEKYTEIR